MKLERSFVVSLAIDLVQSRILPRQGLQWTTYCPDITTNSTLPYECSDLQVPLDYEEPARGNINLQLIRIPSPVQPARGSVLFNFGGPGAEARDTMLLFGPHMQASTGGMFDLVAFDPRGTANTIPFNCSTNEIDLYALPQGFHIGNSSDIAVGQSWAYSHVVTRQCQSLQGDIGQFIGTGFAARDLMSVADALDEDGLLRFWGLSYGSTLGVTVAAMFPDRIDRMIIDGVQNAQEYYHSLGIVQQWTDTDTSFSGIWSTCLEAGPSLCPLAASWNNSSELENAVWVLIYSLKEHPIAVGSNMSFVFDYTAVKGLFIGALYTTDFWPTIAAITDKLLQKQNDDELYALLASVFPVTPTSSLPNSILSVANLGIQCSDRTAHTNNLADLQPVFQEIGNLSRLMDGVTDSIVMSCSVWPMQAKGGYNGSFTDVRTRHPMLVIGNRFDGHTPLISAYNASAGFPGSAVLEIDGYGHGSVNLQSACAVAATAAYFVNGTLPVNGTVCPVDVAPYHIVS